MEKQLRGWLFPERCALSTILWHICWVRNISYSFYLISLALVLSWEKNGGAQHGCCVVVVVAVVWKSFSHFLEGEGELGAGHVSS